MAAPPLQDLVNLFATDQVLATVEGVDLAALTLHGPEDLGELFVTDPVLTNVQVGQ